MVDTRWSAAPAVVSALLALSSMLVAAPASALDPRAEGAAKDAIKKTAADFASQDYATAAARLEKAFAQCSAKKCSPGTKAFVLRDLGTMQFRMGDKDAAANSFSQALAIDHDIEISSKYDAPDLRAAWNHAKALAATTRSEMEATQRFSSSPMRERGASWSATPALVSPELSR